VSGQQHAPAALYPQERPGTYCTGGWVGPRAGLTNVMYLSYKYMKLWWYFAGMWMFKRRVVDLIIIESSSLSLSRLKVTVYFNERSVCLHSNWVVLVTSRWGTPTNNNYFKVKVNKLFNNKDHYTMFSCVNNITVFILQYFSMELLQCLYNKIYFSVS